MFKKTSIWLSAILTGCLLLLIILNVFDAPDEKLLYTEKDLNSVVSKGTDNGFYWLLSLREPQGVDVKPKDVISAHRPVLTEGDAGTRAQKGITDQIDENSKDWNFRSTDFNVVKTKDVFEFVNADINRINADAGQSGQMLERLERAVNTLKVDDFSTPGFTLPTLPLEEFNKITDLYLKLLIIEGSRDGWGKVAERFLDLLDFSYKMILSSRPVTNSILAQRLFEKTLGIWNKALSNPGTEPDLYGRTIQELGEFRSGGFSFRNSFVYEYIKTVGVIQRDRVQFSEIFVITASFSPKLFFVNHTVLKNITIGALNEYYSELAEKHKQPPYVRVPLKAYSKSSSFFWWIRNYGGKIFIEMMTTGHDKLLNMPYTAHALNDMSILSAMLKSERVVPDDIPEWLEAKAKDGFIDPFSGNPYQWHEKEKSLKLDLDEKPELHKQSISVPF